MRLLPLVLAYLDTLRPAHAPQLGGSSSQAISPAGTDAELRLLCRSLVPGWQSSDPLKLKLSRCLRRPAG